MRDTFVKELMSIAQSDRDVVLMTGDLGFGVLQPYWEAFPDQFVNAGIAEQNMTGMAAGMALGGKTVFTYSIGNFPTLRCLEQIRNDCAYHGANVKIVCVGGGFAYGSLGMSHHATEDLAIMRSLPDVTVLAPSDPEETLHATRLAWSTPGTVYLRLGRGGEPSVHDGPVEFPVGGSLTLHAGHDVAILTTGAIISEALRARDILVRHGLSCNVTTFPSAKPIDSAAIAQFARDVRLIVSVEEGQAAGGFGSAVAELVSGLVAPRARLIRIGLDDRYSSIVGSQSYLVEQYGLDGTSIAQRVLGEIDADLDRR